MCNFQKCQLPTKPFMADSQSTREKTVLDVSVVVSGLRYVSYCVRTQMCQLLCQDSDVLVGVINEKDL